MPDRATIRRREKTGENEIGEPEYDKVDVDEDVPARFDDESTSFERVDGGERVQRPATVTVPPDTDVQEGDNVELDGHSTTYEVRGVREAGDNRRGTASKLVLELERAD